MNYYKHEVSKRENGNRFLYHVQKKKKKILNNFLINKLRILPYRYCNYEGVVNLYQGNWPTRPKLWEPRYSSQPTSDIMLIKSFFAAFEHLKV